MERRGKEQRSNPVWVVCLIVVSPVNSVVAVVAHRYAALAAPVPPPFGKDAGRQAAEQKVHRPAAVRTRVASRRFAPAADQLARL
jgi:hypothetical protein